MYRSTRSSRAWHRRAFLACVGVLGIGLSIGLSRDDVVREISKPFWKQ